MLLPLSALTQKTINGKVFDVTNNKPLSSASVIANGNNAGIATNDDGTFILRIDSNIRSISVSYTGYEVRIIRIDHALTEYLIGLHPVRDLAGITVVGSRNLSRTKYRPPYLLM